VTRAKVLEELQAAIEVARLKDDPMAMIAGWREIAKICGYYAPERRKLEVSVDGAALQAKFAAMSDEGLLALADGRELSD
jgi:phage terminase small subunit